MSYKVWVQHVVHQLHVTVHYRLRRFQSNGQVHAHFTLLKTDMHSVPLFLYRQMQDCMASCNRPGSPGSFNLAFHARTGCFCFFAVIASNCVHNHNLPLQTSTEPQLELTWYGIASRKFGMPWKAGRVYNPFGSTPPNVLVRLM